MDNHGNGNSGNSSGWRHVIAASRYSLQGLRAAWHNEVAFRQEIGLCLILVPLGFWLGRSAVEHALLIGTLLIVLIAELLNSALEAVVDRFGPERHELAGRAKDLGSAAVFVALVLVVLVWGLILFERFPLT